MPEGLIALGVVGVVGLGSMGEGIATALARSGVEVIGVEVNQDVRERIARRTTGSTIVVSSAMADLRHANIVIEAVSEQAHLKVSVLREIVATCPEHAIVVTTTSSISVPYLAIMSGRPDRVLGLRLFLPPPFSYSAEPVRAPMTSQRAVDRIGELVIALGATRATVTPTARAVTTELVLGYLNRAAGYNIEGSSTCHDVDTAMRLGCGLPFGPFELLDLLGVDWTVRTLERLYEHTGDATFKPAAQLLKMTAEGRTGRTASLGFYRYTSSGEQVAPESTAALFEPAKEIAKIGIVGSGTMAVGIAEATAAADVSTVLVARSPTQVAAALSGIRASLDRAVRRGRLTACARDTTLEHIVVTDEQAAVADCDLVIEAVVEDISVKRSVFRALDAIVKPEAVLATCTSSLSVAECASVTSRPSRVVGLHFFNPATVMKLVEVVHTDETESDVLAALRALCALLGKTGVECTDKPGFIVNYLLLPYLNDAIRSLVRNDAVIEDVDDAVKSLLGYPCGPFALIDIIGTDVSLAILRSLQAEFPGNPLQLSPALEQLVTNGRLGRKVGQGFLEWKKPGTDSLK